ncbi:MAG: hypothetical protein K6G55_05170 [Selenomonadaceae bacterium]|nr:hypothetical protein [Selenomonadaceae bacterium]
MKDFLSRTLEELPEIIFRLRFYLCAAIFLLCIIFEIHGSSTSLYAGFFGYPELSGNLLGHSRPIRSDEWAVFTPFALSQYFNDFGFMTEIIRGTTTNIFIVYGQAVHHLAMIFRPAQLGYLFLDAGSGLAFFWYGRIIALFIVSFEFARKVLNTNRSLALIYAIMITFSPLAQWWWSVNSVAEILGAGQGIVLFWKLYLTQEDRKRFLYAVMVLWCSGIFIMGIYPAWQVPFGWVFLMCLIAVTAGITDAWKHFRRDIIFWLIGIVLILAPICHVFYISLDVVEITRATEYPGTRFVAVGGLNILYQMLYGICIALPFSEVIPSGIISNNCEGATFFSLTPLGLILFVLLTFKYKKFDLMMTLLVALSIFMMIWEVIGFPEFLAKITMMSMSLGNRVRNVIDFIQLLILFRGLSLIDFNFNRVTKILIAGIISVACSVAAYNFFGEWIVFGRALSITSFVFITIYFLIGQMTKLRTVILVVMMLAIGATVNPIAHGVDCIYKIPIGQKIAEIASNDKSLWIVEGFDVTLNNFPIMFGAPTVNSVNTYPVLERWQKIDSTGENFKIYNRYAHISITFTNDKTSFNLKRLDLFALTLNPIELPKLDVKYIFSNTKDLEKFSSANVTITKIFEDRISYIYRIDYADI